MTEHQLQGPIVNINGTSAEELLDQQRAVHDAAEALLVALRHATPHGRDYQGNDAALTIARMEHRYRVDLAERIHQESLLLALAIQGQTR